MAKERQMFEDWMIAAAYDIATTLPTDPVEALAVLAIVHDLIEKVNKPYALGLRPRLAKGRSGAARKRRPISGVTKSRSPR